MMTSRSQASEAGQAEVYPRVELTTATFDPAVASQVATDAELCLAEEHADACLLFGLLTDRQERRQRQNHRCTADQQTSAPVLSC